MSTVAGRVEDALAADVRGKIMKLENIELVIVSERRDTRKIRVYSAIAGIVANVSSQAANILRMRWDAKSNSVVVRGAIPLDMIKLILERGE